MAVVVVKNGRWTEEGITLLRKLAKQRGASAKDIGRQLGVSREAVIGKCWRENIALPLSKGGW